MNTMAFSFCLFDLQAELASRHVRRRRCRRRLRRPGSLISSGGRVWRRSELIVS
jgi:hypothetical protein